MKQRSCYAQIQEHMATAPLGAVFATTDFKSCGTAAAVRKALSRLVEVGFCQRIMPSIFYRPAFSELFNEYEPPNPYEVATALARNYDWIVVPSPIVAQNALGLSTQVPADLTYTSSGPTRKYEVGGIPLYFKQSRSKYLTKMSYKSALLVNAFQGLNGLEISETDLNRVANKLSKKERLTLSEEKHLAPRWMDPYINYICSV